MKKKIFTLNKRYLRPILLCMFFGAIHGNAFSQDTTTGLILHYSCDNITSSNVEDDSGNNNNGTLTGGAVSTTGYSGNGIACIAHGDYLSIPDNINSGLTSFTFATWVKLNSLKSATRFFDWGSGIDGTNNYLAFVPSFNGDNDYMVLRYRGASGLGYNAAATEKIPTNQWVHVAISYQWSGLSGTATFYINGNNVGSVSNLPYRAGSTLGTTTDNYIAHSRWAQDTNGFDGVLDDIRIYNRALTSEDIISLIGLEELYNQYDLLDLGDLSSVTNNLSLPVTGGSNGVTISWDSSHNTIIDNEGNVTRPDYFDYDVTLTATLSYGTFSIEKEFTATVLADESSAFTSELLVQFDFSDVDNTSIYDVAGKHFEGTLKNSASVVTIGTQETGIFNVLNLGSVNGYFDMGTEVGKVASRLSDYTMSAYFRIDNNYSALSSYGNFIWNFSNSTNAASDQNGYIICSLKDQSVSVSPGYYTTGSGNQAIGFQRQALKGNWHNITYTQDGETATLYIDGIPVQSKTITNLPSTSILKDGSDGTLYNWIGRSCYTGDVYLRGTLIYDFRIYNRALSEEEIKHTEINTTNRLTQLENASEAYIGTSKTAETESLEVIYNPWPSSIEILETGDASEKIAFDDFKYLTFSENETSILFTDYSSRSITNSVIEKIIFSDISSAISLQPVQSTISVYPNPAKNKLFVTGLTSSDKFIYIYSISGQLLAQKQISATTEQLDISFLKSGVYILKTNSDTLKFCKQ
ncbi:LamG-like jellyroll fold domain-containing protein [Plebeiibacterium marinum]|uniref:T9SS type A sorting domain-containing protein n=1 Tax=Plebeiibacterium marinum TaxID=2992111 RepID=A0AAE3SL43_9BACT|nr:LamG-like jellyroll fold domain-containing protein [Plebeiobacterium marinum]MCW3807515.1 T9SS type A sorting domain-containing protein [Plebeiobacterium marinum]